MRKRDERVLLCGPIVHHLDSALSKSQFLFLKTSFLHIFTFLSFKIVNQIALFALTMELAMQRGEIQQQMAKLFQGFATLGQLDLFHVLAHRVDQLEFGQLLLGNVHVPLFRSESINLIIPSI